MKVYVLKGEAPQATFSTRKRPHTRCGQVWEEPPKKGLLHRDEVTLQHSQNTTARINNKTSGSSIAAFSCLYWQLIW